MATLISTILTNTRLNLQETTANFWTDAELIAIMNDGIKELWRSILDLYQDHMITIDETNMSITASSSTVTGVPTDVFRIVNIQPRTLGASSSNPGLVFKPATLTDPRFIQAQALPPQSPRNRVIYYATINAGAPVGAPTIRIAPQVSSAVNLAVWYNPTLAAKASSDTNPIPGESDRALMAYTIAWARAKEKGDRSPDAEYISIYATEKRNLLIALTPRSVQEVQTVDGLFEITDPSADEDW